MSLIPPPYSLSNINLTEVSGFSLETQNDEICSGKADEFLAEHAQFSRFLFKESLFNSFHTFSPENLEL